MATPPFPILRYLTPDPAAAAPDGFAVIDEAIDQGIPHRMQLTSTVLLQIVMPHGVAASWQGADPAAVVSTSAAERAPFTATGANPGAVTHVPLRLVLRMGNSIVGSAPLVVGTRFFLPASGDGVHYEFEFLNWTVTAGTVQGPGPYGSKLTLAWRQADQAIDNFSTPPVAFKVVERLPLKFRMLSELGLRNIRMLERFTLKKVVIR